MGTRLTAYLRHKRLPQKKIAELSGVSKATVSRFCGGGVIASDKLARILRQCDDLSLEWFFFGTGEMLRSRNADVMVNNGVYAGADVVTDNSVHVANARGVNVTQHGQGSNYQVLLAEKDRLLVEKDKIISDRDETIRELLRIVGKR